MASIYNIADWSNALTYKKNSVVKNAEKYWYALQEVAAGTTPQLNSPFWNGNISITIDGTVSTEPYFFWSPSYNLQVSHEPRIKSFAFGDGYEQRVKDGIHNNPLVFNLTFDNRDEAEAAAILHFLHSREGYAAFYFKAPAPYSLIKRFVCKTFNSSFVFANNYTIQATFVEVP